MAFTCRNCGARSAEKHSLCNVDEDADVEKFCGIPEEWVCDEKRGGMKVICQTCGSLSAAPENLCNPRKLE